MRKNMNKKGEVAMGTLIIFIAMILIAAVAAAVLISSIGSIQSKALQTGSATTQEIGTNLNVVEIYGQKDDTDSTMTNYSMVIRLAAGSESIRLGDLLLTVGTETFSNEFIFNSTVVVSNMTVPTNVTHKGDFVVDYLLKGNNNVLGYIVKGDVVRMNFNLEAPIGEDSDLKITLIPKVGTPANVIATTPTTIASKRETVFP